MYTVVIVLTSCHIIYGSFLENTAKYSSINLSTQHGISSRIVKSAIAFSSALLPSVGKAQCRCECHSGARSSSSDSYDLCCKCPLLIGAASDDPWYNPFNQRIYDTMRKSYLPPHPELYLRKELDNKKVVIIGEIHSNPCHHKVEFEIVRSLTSATSDGLNTRAPITIGLEAFYRQHQRALDDFVFKHKRFDILQKETDWTDTWGYDLNFYAKLFSFASQHNIRLIGLNAPNQLVRLVSEVGLDGLPQQLKSFLPAVDLRNARHRKQFYTAIGVPLNSGPSFDGIDVKQVTGAGAHGVINPRSLERMYEAQTLWDEYMAESVANFMQSYPDNLLVVIAGLGHVKGRVGIPDRIERRTKQAPFVIVPQAVDWLDNGLPDVDFPLKSNDCDWAWYTEQEIATG